MERHILPSSFMCTNCQHPNPLDVYSYECKECKWPLKVSYAAERMDPSRIREALESARRLWDFFGFLPVLDPRNIVTLGEGGTPLLHTPYFEESKTDFSVLVKNESTNPTGSFKDRPLSVILSEAKEDGAEKVVTGSSGNAGVALSAYAARAGMEAIVIVPQSAPREKLVAMKAYGANVIMVNGNTSQALNLANRLSRTRKWINATTNFQNPYGLEGDKTVAYEIARDLGFESPSHVLIPIGAGPLLVGCYNGFYDLYKWGLISSIPRLVGIQAEGCAPIARAFQQGNEFVKSWDRSETIASGIADELRGYETDGALTLRIVRRTGGLCLSVSDEEIIKATSLLAKKSGIFAEPTGAVSLAGLMKLTKSADVSLHGQVVCVVTGTGFKDIHTLETHTGIDDIPLIRPRFDDLMTICGQP